jgi:aspartate aminotransferase
VLLAHPHVWVLTDEIYDEISYDDDPPPTPVAVEPGLADRVLITNGVSKTYAMTGWRIGYGAGPAELIGATNTLQSQISSCPSSISQAAAVAALTGDQGFVRVCVTVYQGRQDRTVKLLGDIPGCPARPRRAVSTCSSTASPCSGDRRRPARCCAPARSSPATCWTAGR